MKKLFAITLITSCLALTGCKALSSAIGANPSAPTAVEAKIFTIQTNWVTETTQVLKTNFVTVEVTNTANQVVTQTNTVTQVVTLTNTVAQYALAPSPTATGTIATVGAVTNTIMPGMGGVVSAGLTGILGLWAWLRSNKQGAANTTTLAQEIETLREFIQSLPNGVKYDTAITAWLQAHQMDAGVAKQVLAAVENDVSNPDAKVAAASIITTLTTLGTPVPQNTASAQA